MNSLGFNKAPSDTRVVVAMSGGVDSSVVAALLHEQGYEVIGVTLQLYDHGEALKKKGACCAGQDIYDAKRIAELSGFPHYVLDYESNFKQSVIDDFANTYMMGQTPIPCVRCNQTVKFRDLLSVARDLDADCMATGHYVQRQTNDKTGKPQLIRAKDLNKDQSYFLFATTQEQLDFLRFPLGGWHKETTRKHAERLGLITAEKPDSQDICFVPNGNYAQIVKKLRPESEKPGDIIDMNGQILGKHEGIIGYTIGQRKGLGIGGGHNDNNDPFYVIEINPASNTIVVGPKQALAKNTIYINDCNWLGTADKSFKGEIKFRSIMQPVPAQIELLEKNEAVINLATPQYGIAPGQAAVCYLDDKVLGGGWIYKSENTALDLAASSLPMGQFPTGRVGASDIFLETSFSISQSLF
jgi:tRNA-specific 2-thiouridylase